VVAGSQRGRCVVGDFGLVSVGPDQHLERQVERGQGRGGHHRRARLRAAEEDQRGFPQREPSLAGLGRLVDHGEQPHPFRGDHAGELGHGTGYRFAAELGYDIGLGGGSILGHGQTPSSVVIVLMARESFLHERGLCLC